MVNTLIARFLFAVSLAILCSPGLNGQRMASEHAAPTSLLAGTELAFVENRGQWDGPAVFTAWLGRNLAASLEPDGVALRLGGERTTEVRLLFEGASAATTIVGEESGAASTTSFSATTGGRTFPRSAACGIAGSMAVSMSASCRRQTCSE